MEYYLWINMVETHSQWDQLNHTQSRIQNQAWQSQ